ncbi:winged helix-turn-helix domain-containing protein [Dokdonella sp. MW10]|uniref:winged helix-turn-helix domain-containing protein n=1 Tax=Dokdonella sp. MW10 TaxID=2992926 RepID=UPI003F803B8F
MSTRRYRLDDLVVDLDRQRVTRDGTVLEVGGLTFRLLECFVRHGDRVLGFDALIDEVWSPAVVGEETVTQRVKLLRQALGDDGRQSRYVRSVRGSGYQLCHVPEPLVDDVVGAPAPATASAAPRGIAARRAIVVSVAVVLVAAAVIVLVLRARPQVPPAPMADTSDDALARARHYAAIGQRDNNERAIALFEDVLARTPHDAAARIGLSFALSARMCLYDFPPAEAERAEAIARERLAEAPDDAGAHAALAYALDCRGFIDDALAAYRRAHALDPAGRADSLASAANLLAVKGRLAEALEANLAVGDAGARLRFLEVQVARTLELLGFTTVAEQRYARVFRLFPDNVFGNVAWPRHLFLQGRFAEARAALAEAMARPRHPDLFLLAGELALLDGDREAAAQAFGEARAARPHAGMPVTLATLFGAAPPDEAWRTARREVLRHGIDAGDRWPDSWLELAILEADGGHHAAALDALDAAIAAGFSDRAWLQTSPLFRPLAGEPRFATAIDTIGRRVAGEREHVLAANWLPADLLAARRDAPVR